MREEQVTSLKPPLDRLIQADIIDLVLWAGQLLMQSGAESQRIEEVIHRLGTGLGCDWMDVLVSHGAIIATCISGHDFRTKIRRVPTIGVNMDVVAQVNDLSYRIEEDKTLDRFALRKELERISGLTRQYNRWQIVGMVGLACAAFSRLFGGDWAVFAVTLVASGMAMFIRQELQKRHFNPLLVVIVTAFVAGFFASSAALFDLSEEPDIALASSVLLLVPGVQLINAAEDLIKGHLTVGLTRGVAGILVSLGIALGLLIAMAITGVSGF